MTISESTTSSPQLERLRGEEMRRPDEVAAMLRLSALGWGTKRIALEFGCSRNTVKRRSDALKFISQFHLSILESDALPGFERSGSACKRCKVCDPSGEQAEPTSDSSGSRRRPQRRQLSMPSFAPQPRL